MKADMIVSVAIMTTVLAVVTHAMPLDESTDFVQNYFHKYGYSRNSEQLATLVSVEQGIKDFQKKWGLKITGKLDESTRKLMNTSRCGVPDDVGSEDDKSRRKRYSASRFKFDHINITYKINNYPTDLPKRDVDDAIQSGFDVWSAVSDLTFTRKSSGAVDIDIWFATGDHLSDNNPFDGERGTLAHAFFPGNFKFSGDAHFDEAERWTVRVSSGINLFYVAAHEFGHSLGLYHSSNRNALMAPFYRGYQPSLKLHEDDVAGVQAIYGKPSKSSTTKPSTQPPTRATAKTTTQTPRTETRRPATTTTLSAGTTTATPSAGCDGTVSPDAITHTQDGSLYLFQGEYYSRLLDSGLAPDFPRKISADWPGLPSHLDAALFWSYSGYTFFFKGDKYWKFRNRVAVRGYPRLISRGFSGVPDDLDAAFVWGGNGVTYFIKGAQYYRYSGRSVSRSYPRPLAAWRDLPSSVGAAFLHHSFRTYFFSGTQYYRFDDYNFMVDRATPSYPRDTKQWWLRCPSASNNLAMPGSEANETRVYMGEDALIPSEDQAKKADSDLREEVRHNERDEATENESTRVTSGVATHTCVHVTFIVVLFFSMLNVRF